MYSVSNMMHKIHLPHGHGLSEKMSHVIHDQRFWAVVALIAVTLFIITLAIVTSPVERGTTSPPLLPSYPMGF